MSEPIVTVFGVGALGATEYVAGVLPAEMPASWPIEALRAQAVAIQSYALAKGRVYADTRDQVYNPAKRTARTDQVAREMAGYVGQVNGKTVPMFYSASCGGQTTATWAPYLRAVECPCGRARNGHGQGLCQYGAKALAEQGKTWREIINHYYALTVVPNWGQAPGSVLSFQIQRPNPEQWIIDAVRESGVTMVKVLDPPPQPVFGADPDYIARFTFPNNADAQMVYRGREGADTWWANVEPRMPGYVAYVEGPNEPVVTTEEQARQFVAFEKRRQDLLFQRGLVPLSGVFGTGNPPFTLFGILGEALCRPGAVYARHSYGMRKLAPADWSWEWHVMRHRKDWQALADAGFPRPPTMITETGIDYSGNPERDGWRAQGLSAEQYVAQLVVADAEWRKDGVQLAIPFLWADYNWPSFRMTKEVTRVYTDYIASQQGGTAVDPLPEIETATDARTLAQKCRWWYEEETRMREAGNTARADAIHLSLTKLLYRLENALA